MFVELLRRYTGLTSKFANFASMESSTCGCCGEALLASEGKARFPPESPGKLRHGTQSGARNGVNKRKGDKPSRKAPSPVNGIYFVGVLLNRKP